MRVAFAGTPPFAATALQAIAAAGHDVVLVLTQPDRPAGRGLKLTSSAVAGAAISLGFRVEKPASLRNAEAQRFLGDAQVDVMVVAAYGLILPPEVLGLPRLGCINIHASLLPRWRGAAPIQRAILAGDTVTGISIMQMEAGLDTGPVLLTRARPIGPRDTTKTLTQALADLGGDLVVDALADPAGWSPTPQDASRASYAAKVAKTEARLDWADANVVLDRQVRAFDPAPGAEAVLCGETVKIWRAEPVPGAGMPPGAVQSAGAEGIVVACGEGSLRVTVLQRPGGRRLDAGKFIHGSSLAPG